MLDAIKDWISNHLLTRTMAVSTSGVGAASEVGTPLSDSLSAQVDVLNTVYIGPFSLSDWMRLVSFCYILLLFTLGTIKLVGIIRGKNEST